LTVSPHLRALALMPLAALAVHEVRFALAPATASGGHGYLELVAAAAGILCALVVAELVFRVSRRGATPSERAGLRWVRLWLLATAGLLAVYAGQELIETAMCGCRPAGAAAVVGGGGWLALPAALAVGGLLALALRGAEAVVARAAGRARPRRRVTAPSAPTPVFAIRLRPAPLASAAAGRAPPGLAPVR
jgi:hypothetical protein